MYNRYMNEAIILARSAAAHGETPIGAVIVRGEDIIARACNMREKEKNSLCHAEIIAIDEACKFLGGWRLDDCDMYVTLEPCAMCAGAIALARIKKLYFGAYDKEAGCVESKMRVLSLSKTEFYGGIMEDECARIIKDFFMSLRSDNMK